MSSFAEKLQQRIAQTGSNLCIGLDPRVELLSGRLEDFCIEVVESTAEFAAAFKPNIAYFEALGSGGIAALEAVLARIPAGVPVILDAKRGDIPETMRYYARAYFENWNVDAVTLNGYMGLDAIEPFLSYPGKGVYLLGVTSNPGARDIELQRIGDSYVFEHVQAFAARAREFPGTVGLVVGLTNVSDEVLSRVADIPLLVPGLGAQGGDLAALDVAHRTAPVLINASRSILYGETGTPAGRARAARDSLATHFGNQAL